MRTSTLFLTLASVMLVQSAWTQVNFLQQTIIEDNSLGQAFITAADVDGDGDPDVLSAERNTGKLIWYENNNGVFSSANVFASQMPLIHGIEATDADQDGDMDLVVISASLNTITFYDNQGSDPWYSTGFVLEDSALGVSRFQLADLDSDGFTDIVFIEEYGFRLSWIRNESGNGFAAKQTIYNDAVMRFLIMDINTDGILDLAFVDFNGVYRKSIQQNSVFAAPTPFGSATISANHMVSSDLNNDLQKELIISDDAGVIHLYPNDGQGGFGSPIELIDLQNSIEHLTVADIDNDGDEDLVAAGSGSFFWLENEAEVISIGLVISDSAMFPVMTAVTDVDSDGDLDVIGSSSGNSEIVYFQNGLLNGISKVKEIPFRVYPNPVQNQLIVEDIMEKHAMHVSLLNAQGEIVRSGEALPSTGQTTLDVQTLSAGIYFLQVQSQDESYSQQIIKL